MAVTTAEIKVKGQPVVVPAVEIGGRTVLSRGKWIRTAVIHDQDVVEGDPVKDPPRFIAALKQSGLKADVFTFFQRPPDLKPRHPYHYDWKNYAAVPVTTFEAWWEALPQEARKNTRRAAKRGVKVDVAVFNDDLVRGIHKLCNETPVRQGRPFWHYGKDFDAIKRMHATYLDRCDFIAAYFQDELVGYIKMVYADRIAFIFHIIAANDHYDKRPMNAMIAKAVEVCARKGVQYFVYDQYSYGNKSQSTLAEFKRRNGFQQVDFPIYYVPLTWKGAVYTGLRLYRGLIGLLPEPVLLRAIALRDWLNERRHKAAPAPAKSDDAG